MNDTVGSESSQEFVLVHEVMSAHSVGAPTDV
jgi:hypothetical protein